MNTLVKEIDLFLKTSDVSIATKERHNKNLIEFANFLSIGKKVDVNEIHLLEIFTIKTFSGNEKLKHNPINSDVIDYYFSSLSGLSYNQLLLIKNSLGAFFKSLEHSYDFLSPMRQMEFNVDALKPLKRPAKTFSRRDVLKFLHTLVSTSVDYHRDLTMFCLIFATGCRISEILKLRKRQINFSLELIKLEKTKSGKEQTVVLRTGMGNVLRLYCKERELSDDDVLFKNKFGRPMQYGTARRLFKEYIVNARIPDSNLHVTRHTFATHLFENGSELSIIQQLLRHKDKQTTVGYVHPNYVRNYGIKVKNNKKLYEQLRPMLNQDELD